MVERRKRFVLIVVFTVAYVALGKLGQALALVNPTVTAVWPNSGVALAVLLMLGYELWPGVLIGAFLVSASTTGLFAPSMAIAIGHTLEAVVGVWLVCRYANGRNAIFSTRTIFFFLTLAGLISTAISATIGVTSLVAAGLVPVDRFSSDWLTWWLGHATGDIIIAPIALVWFAPQGKPWNWSRFRPEAVALLVAVFLVGQTTFGGVLAPNFALAYLSMPCFAWAGFRFGQREAAVTMLVFAASAIWEVFSFAPFSPNALNESLLLQAFLGVSAVTNMILATEVAERRRAEAEARALATVDSLTGLDNHRKFVNDLDMEIRRAERNGRMFAVLLIDLDGLKRINDTLGHLNGNRALCRLADVIRCACRSADTTARYGGDEFAVILQESDAETAYRVAGRIRKGLAKHMEPPELSVSIGVAVWPDDGQSVETLLGNADAALYAMKKRSGGRARVAQPNSGQAQEDRTTDKAPQMEDRGFRQGL